MVDRSLFSLTWPIFIDISFVFLVSVVDAWFLSQISDTAAGAVGAILPVAGLGFTLFLNLSLAGNSVASQRIGAADKQSLSGTYAALIYLMVLLGLAVSLIFIFFSDLLAGLMGLTGEMSGIAATYLHILGFGATFLALRYSANAILTSQGKTHWNMCSTGIMTLANLGLNYVFVYGALGAPKLGTAGVAISTCLAWAISLAFSAFIILNTLKMPIAWRQSRATLVDMCRPILRIGLPSTLEPVSWHLSQVLIIMLVVSLGELALATRVYTYNILFVVALFGTALSFGVQLKVAHFIGASRFDDAQHEMLRGLRFGLCGAGSIVALLYIGAPFFLGFFTENPDIIQLGQVIILVAFACELGRLMNMVTGASLKASGDAKFVSLFGLVVMWLVAVPLAWWLGIAMGLGLVGIWLALTADELTRGGIALLRWKSNNWRTSGVYSALIVD